MAKHSENPYQPTGVGSTTQTWTPNRHFKRPTIRLAISFACVLALDLAFQFISLQFGSRIASEFEIAFILLVIACFYWPCIALFPANMNSIVRHFLVLPAAFMLYAISGKLILPFFPARDIMENAIKAIGG